MYHSYSDGIETIVEVSDQNTKVTVVMILRRLKESEMRFIKQRSSIVKQILLLCKLCPQVKPKEFIIHPHCLCHYPLQASAEFKIPMTQVTEAIVEKHSN